MTDRWYKAVLLLLAGMLGGVLPVHAADRIFARLDIEPQTVYAAQPFTLTLSIYTSGEDIDKRIAGLPEAFQLQPFQEMGVVREIVDGRAYQVHRSKCEAVCPVAGTLQFAPVVQGMAIRRVQTLFLVQEYRTSFEAPVAPVSMTVKAVPINAAPAGYAGLIGSFRLEAACSTNRFLPGDLVNLTFTVTGRGRFDLLPPLGIQPAPGFKVYPPRPVQGGSATGTRAWSQVVVPLDPSSTPIPGLSLVFFNPELESFETLAVGPFPLALDTDRPPTQAPPVFQVPDPDGEPELPDLPIHDRVRVWVGDPDNRIQAESYFISGNDAYRAGRMSDAIDAYAKILVLGFRLPEVTANLGAACLRSGQTGRAMLFLLRTLRAAPRDPVARAHLALVLDRHPDLAAPALPVWSRLTRQEWRRVAVIALILLAPLLFVHKKGWQQALALLLCLAVLAGAAGSIWWSLGPPRDERIVTTGAQGHSAPAPDSMPTFRLPEGFVVMVLDEREDWVRVAAGAGSAWIPSPSMEKP